MERFFLILALATLSSCQLSNVIPADSYSEAELASPIKSEAVYENVWQRISINAKSEIENLDALTLEYVNLYLANPEQFIKLLVKGEHFIFFVLEELEKYNLPPELALLPYIESNYDPFSISASGAMGLWQFMPATARIYGLQDTWWYEQRHDPLISTEAAVKYLAYLHQRFGKNLAYTLSAYNGGPTMLEKQIKLNKRLGKSVHYRQLKVPKQTQEYVPKFKAILELIVNAKEYNIELPDFPDRPVLGQITLDGQIEILAFSEFAELQPEFIYKLNAGYTKWASPPGKTTIFNIPIELVELLDQKKDQFSQANQINWVTHKVASGDSLWSIAENYDTEVGVLKKVNYLKSSKLNVNQELLIPLSNSNNQTFIPYQAHIISEGDTLWNLGLKYSISPNEIAKNNELKMTSALVIGRELNIGNKNIYRTINSKKRTILYSVKQGDSLYRIANIFNIEIQDILDINAIEENQIKPGQVIKIIIKAF
ncbi:LysM peptidoglycan-binding domain-containing protein [Gammaproteobacteria bacterium]|jgi:membrane-bound lytic murein transglycosylase D|nr:LysM peptidoglycan-binding domain-containing protein [Gammaproteobacteria bacterium]